MADANVATLRAGYDALNRGDVSEVMALIADDITWDPGELTPDRDAEASGPAGFEALIRSWIDAFDDFHIEPLVVTEQGPFLICVRSPVGTRTSKRAGHLHRDCTRLEGRERPCDPARVVSQLRGCARGCRGGQRRLIVAPRVARHRNSDIVNHRYGSNSGASAFSDFGNSHRA